jgi:hypothetical protein
MSPGHSHQLTRAVDDADAVCRCTTMLLRPQLRTSAWIENALCITCTPRAPSVSALEMSEMQRSRLARRASLVERRTPLTGGLCAHHRQQRDDILEMQCVFWLHQVCFGSRTSPYQERQPPTPPLWAHAGKCPVSETGRRCSTLQTGVQVVRAALITGREDRVSGAPGPDVAVARSELAAQLALVT